MANASHATWFLVASLVVSALGLAELFLGGSGVTFPFAQLTAVALGFVAYAKGASRPLASVAIGANVALVIALVIGSFLFGGT